MNEIDKSNFATIPGGFERIKLAVYTNEGKIPHFHFYHDLPADKGIPLDKRNGGGCICFLEPKYFSHDSHTEKMNSKEIKELKKFLMKKHKKDDKTNWEVMINEWNHGEHGIKIPIDANIPDYRSYMKNVLDKENT